MTKNHWITVVSIISLLALGQTALAADIGIMGNSNNNLIVVDIVGNKTKYSNVLDSNSRILFLANRGFSTDSVFTTQSDETTWSGDFLSVHDGLEYIKTDNRQVRIYDSTGNHWITLKPAVMPVLEHLVLVTYFRISLDKKW